MTENIMNIDTLWSAVCNRDWDTIEEYYGNGWTPGVRYEKFGKKHSLIAGAYRNNNYDVVDYLISQGETTEEHETDINTYLVVLRAKRLVDFYKNHNKNLTKWQYYYFLDLQEALQNLKDSNTKMQDL